MAEGILSRWPSVRQMLSTYAEDAGYLSLQTYYADRGGEQVGRFDVTNEFIGRWLPSKEGEAASGSIDFNLGTVSTDLESQEVEEVEEQGGATEEEPQDTESEGSEDEGISEPTADPIDPVDLLNAARAWLYETCEDNTPDGETQRFRLRIHSDRGKKQLWSGILDYESGKEKPREAHQPIDLPTFERKPVFTENEDSPPDTDSLTNPPSPGERFLSDEEIAFSELLMEHHEDDDLLDFTEELGASSRTEELDDMFTSPTTFHTEPSSAPTVIKRRPSKKGPTTPKGAPSQAIQSLMHLHKSHKEFIDTVLATTKQLVKVQASAMDQLAGTLGDSRNRENALVSAVQGLRIAEAESAVDAAKAQDASQVRSVLGKEAIAQMGLLGQVLLTRNQQDNGTNGGGHVQPEPQPLPQHEPPQIAERPSNGAELYPDMSQGVDLEGIEDGEPPEVDEERLVNLLGWAQSRPDVLEALTDPAVRSYLRTPENVEQLRGLARMLSPTSVEPLPTTPIPSDLEGGAEATNEAELNPETLESSTEENPPTDNEQE